jgi:hypothetical protein
MVCTYDLLFSQAKGETTQIVPPPTATVIEAVVPGHPAASCSGGADGVSSSWFSKIVVFWQLARVRPQEKIFVEYHHEKQSRVVGGAMQGVTHKRFTCGSRVW